MNKNLSAFAATIVLIFSTLASANETFWTLVQSKQYAKALRLIESDPTVEVDWVPGPGVPTAASMVSDVKGVHEGLRAAIWKKKSGLVKTYSRDVMFRRICSEAEDPFLKATYRTGFECDESGMRVLHWLGFAGNLDLIRYYLEQNDFAELINSSLDVVGDSFLHSAIYGENEISRGRGRDHRDIVEYLVSRGANINSRGEYGKTPLVLAAQWGLARMVKLLIRLHAQLDLADDNGRTALYHAVDNAQPRAVRALLEAGADVTLADIRGRTPLHVAAALNNQALVRVLVAHGAFANIADNDGQTAAQATTNQRIRALLQDPPVEQGNRNKGTKRTEAPAEIEQAAKAPKAMREAEQEELAFAPALTDPTPATDESNSGALEVARETLQHMLAEIGETLGDQGVYALLVSLRYAKGSYKQ